MNTPLMTSDDVAQELSVPPSTAREEVERTMLGRDDVAHFLRIDLTNVEESKAMDEWLAPLGAFPIGPEALDRWIEIHTFPSIDRGVPSCVYFIEADNGLIKIGRSQNVMQRFAGLAAASPTPLRLLGFIADTVSCHETRLHELFAAQRHHGEWFTPTPELHAAIRSLLAVEGETA